MKILVLKRDKIGDMLLMTPMLRHLRASRPDAQIHVLANDYNAWVVEGNPNIDRLWVYPRARHGAEFRPSAVLAQLRQLWQLRRQRYDFAIAAGGVVSPRAIRRALRVGAARTVAYCRGEECRVLSDPLTLPARVHEVEANLNLLSPLGVAQPDRVIYPEYAPADAWLDFGRRWVADRGLRRGGFVVLGLNARRVKRKPTPDQIRRWSEAFKERWGLDTVLMWQPGEWDDRVYPGDDEMVKPVLAGAPAHLHPFRHEDSVFPALGIIWQAATSVFPDGGIAHLASMSPGGVLALFAETDVSRHPDNWRPYAPCSGYLEAVRTVAELGDEAVLGKVAENLECARGRQAAAGTGD